MLRSGQPISWQLVLIRNGMGKKTKQSGFGGVKVSGSPTLLFKS
jgi:hypothetical protein